MRREVCAPINSQLNLLQALMLSAVLCQIEELELICSSLAHATHEYFLPLACMINA